MDLIAIQALIPSLKLAADLSKSLLDIKSKVEIQSKVSEIQSALLAAQNSALSATTAQIELQQKVNELETQLDAIGDWDDQKQRYLLITPFAAVQAYALKRSFAEGEVAHLLCTNCFHNSKRVILNPTNKDGFALVVCPSCKASWSTGYRRIGSPKYAEEYSEEG